MYVSQGIADYSTAINYTKTLERNLQNTISNRAQSHIKARVILPYYQLFEVQMKYSLFKVSQLVLFCWELLAGV
jgi:hypothetical protein